MSTLPKGTTEGQIIIWNAVTQAWVLNGAPAYPAIDEFDTQRWAYLASSISGSGISNEGTGGAEYDLTSNNQSAFNDPTPPDVWNVPVSDTLEGVSSKLNIKYESDAATTAPDMSNGLTVSTWVRADGSLATDDRVVMKQFATTWTTTFYGVLLAVEGSGGGVRALINGGDTVVASSPNVDAFVQGVWNHVGLTINAAQDTLNLYVNGKLSNTGAINNDPIWGDGPWMLGGRTGSTTNNFEGFLFDVRVAETVRDEAWFRAMYTARHLPMAGIS